MTLNLLEEPRVFGVKGHELKDIGKIFLNNNELVSFKTKSGKEYDFVAKDWGFYASPSVNSRLIKEGFKTALVVNENEQVYVMVVESDKMDIFHKYLADNQNSKIICWLDNFFTGVF